MKGYYKKNKYLNKRIKEKRKRVRRNNMCKETIEISLSAVLIIGMIVFGLMTIPMQYSKSETVVTVTDKGIKGDSGTYMIYGEDEDGNTAVLEITDRWVVGQWDSSDDYARIKVGKTYKFKVLGERHPMLSMYPSIYDYNEIE